MAITGEIDLTQGLDFFRHKELPSIIPRILPWVRDKVNSGKSSLESNTYYLSPVNSEEDLSHIVINTRTTFTNRYSTTIRVNYNLNNTISDSSDSSRYDSLISWYNNTYSNDSITTTISYSNNDTYITCDLDNVNDYIDTDNAYIIPKKKRLESNTKFHLGNIREEKDNSPAIKRCMHCGKLMIGRNPKCKKCIVKEKLYWYPFHKRYPWDEKPEKDTEFDYIPWSQKHTLKRSKSRGSKLREIPWLSNLESRIFGYYEEELRSAEEVDNSSYLTNMSWLGINEQSGRPRYTVQQEAVEFNIISDSDIVVDDTALFVSA